MSVRETRHHARYFVFFESISANLKLNLEHRRGKKSAEKIADGKRVTFLQRRQFDEGNLQEGPSRVPSA